MEFQDISKIDASEWDNTVKKIHEYVNHSDDRVRSECYYCTKYGKIKGMITIKDGIIVFDPLKGQENNKFTELSKYHGYIDLKDIGDAQIIKIPNETAQYIKDENDRQGYIYDYYLQIALSTVNGDTLNRMLKKHQCKHLKVQGFADSKKSGKSKSTNVASCTSDAEKTLEGKTLEDTTLSKAQNSLCHDNVFSKQSQKQAIALTFFRFSHRDEENNALTNKQQALIIDNIYQNIYCKTEKMGDHEYSSTLVPFFDSLIDTDLSMITYTEEALK